MELEIDKDSSYYEAGPVTRATIAIKSYFASFFKEHVAFYGKYNETM